MSNRNSIFIYIILGDISKELYIIPIPNKTGELCITYYIVYYF